MLNRRKWIKWLSSISLKCFPLVIFLLSTLSLSLFLFILLNFLLWERISVDSFDEVFNFSFFISSFLTLHFILSCSGFFFFVSAANLSGRKVFEFICLQYSWITLISSFHPWILCYSSGNKSLREMLGSFWEEKRKVSTAFVWWQSSFSIYCEFQ